MTKTIYETATGSPLSVSTFARACPRPGAQARALLSAQWWHAPARRAVHHRAYVRRITSAVPLVGRCSVPPKGMQKDQLPPSHQTDGRSARIPPSEPAHQPRRKLVRAQHELSSQGRMPRSSPPGRRPASRALGRPGRHADANWGPLVGWSVPQTHASCAAARAFPAAQPLPTATSAAEDATWPRVSRLARLLRHRRLAPQPPSCERARAVSALGKVGKVLAGWLAGGGGGWGWGWGGGRRYARGSLGIRPLIPSHTSTRARARARACPHTRTRACMPAHTEQTHTLTHPRPHLPRASARSRQVMGGYALPLLLLRAPAPLAPAQRARR